jgi:hypothetical protein
MVYAHIKTFTQIPSYSHVMTKRIEGGAKWLRFGLSQLPVFLAVVYFRLRN